MGCGVGHPPPAGWRALKAPGWRADGQRMDRRLPWAALLALVLALVAVPPSSHAFRLVRDLQPVRANPAERLAPHRPDPERYDRAEDCTRRAQPGVRRMVRWLERNARGVLWGTYRCERWGEGSASLHAEGRAIDWHLDVRRPTDKRAARRLIELLLAPDRQGTARALARRMGVQEVIWDCSYWAAGMEEFRRYAPCFAADGETPRRRVDPTVAHRDHLHIGLTRDGAAGRTSFWR